MAKLGKLGGGSKGGRSGAQAAAELAAQDDYGLVVNGTFKGKIRDVEVGPVTGEVTQTNVAVQSGASIAKGRKGGTTAQTVEQAAAQGNVLDVNGEATLDITVNGSFKGKIRDVEVGLVTGEVTQTNVAVQSGANIARGGQGGTTTQTVEQSAAQGNVLQVSGDVDVSLVFDGRFKGQIRDVEIGLLTGDVTQTNVAVQSGANIARGGQGGTTTQTVEQSAAQGNLLAVVGDIDLTIVFDGNFKGQVRDVTIGLVTADISQTNTAIQVGLNVSGGGKGAQAIGQFITQTNTVDANGGIDVTIVIDGDYKGDIRGVEIDVLIDNVVLSNTAAQVASTVSGGDAVWG